ncbi:MAG: 7,8-didemethyl-8-hydroxy-5-deazariboflavin synthase subunit CofG [Archaeoglobi archaeon]|nr:7,8-didemethyl-8-hydroxy-5-deazariboflavin synthase subunit CofG [Candidatus Mnemosynella bozhongmuii]
MFEYVTFSKNIFIPLTNICRNRCYYCGFRRSPGDRDSVLMSPGEVEALLRKRGDATEALFTMGEGADEFEEVRKRLEDFGFDSMVDYVVEMNKIAVENGLLPHTNMGVLSLHEMKKLKKWNASMGLMLETSGRVEAHRESPGKSPELRIQMIENAGKLKIPFTTGILVGIGESWRDRIESLKIIAELHRKYGHIQEVIIQGFSPKKGTPMEKAEAPREEEIFKVVRIARRILPEDVSIQVPPNLHDAYRAIISGANDLGGISSITPDFINPEHSWPAEEHLRIFLRGFPLRRRLPIYPSFILKGWFSSEISHLISLYSDEEGYENAQCF